MLKMIQCRTSPVFFWSATSGSCRIKAKVTVPGGTLVHSNLGETALGSDCVYLAGISPPSENAEVVSVNPGGGGILALSCAIAEPTRAASRNVQIVKVRMRLRITGVAPGRLNRRDRKRWQGYA